MGWWLLSPAQPSPSAFPWARLRTALLAPFPTLTRGPKPHSRQNLSLFLSAPPRMTLLAPTRSLLAFPAPSSQATPSPSILDVFGWRPCGTRPFPRPRRPPPGLHLWFYDGRVSLFAPALSYVPKYPHFFFFCSDITTCQNSGRESGVFHIPERWRWVQKVEAEKP